MRAFAAFAFFLFSSTAWCQVELIKDINTSGSSCMSGFTEMNGSLYFAVNDCRNFLTNGLFSPANRQDKGLFLLNLTRQYAYLLS